MGLHPEGWFTAKITDHGIMNGGDKADALCVEFDTGTGIITGYFYLTDKAIEQTAKKVRAMGYQGDDFPALNDGECIKGNHCEIQVFHEEWDGTLRAKVGWVNSFGNQGGGVKNDDDAAATAGRFNALLKKEPKIDAGEQPEELPF